MIYKWIWRGQKSYISFTIKQDLDSRQFLFVSWSTSETNLVDKQTSGTLKKDPNAICDSSRHQLPPNLRKSTYILYLRYILYFNKSIPFIDHGYLYESCVRRTLIYAWDFDSHYCNHYWFMLQGKHHGLLDQLK